MMERPDNRTSKVARWLIGAFAVYLLPAFVVIADEEYFHWITGQLPLGFWDYYCTLYPWVCGMYGG